MHRTVPLTVLGGYLGSGKTTVINHLLGIGVPRRLAVIVNDFGELAVDAELLAPVADGADGIIDLPNGCVCCTLGTGLMDALGRLDARSDPPEQVLVEASGVADPAAVAAWGHTPGYLPGGVVVVAAAPDIGRQLDDRLIGTTVRRQLEAADVVLLTKVDLVRPSDVTRMTELLGGTRAAPVVPIEAGVVPPAVVLGADPLDRAPAAGAAQHPHYQQSSWQSSVPRSVSQVEGFVAGLDDRVLRLKGWVDTVESGLLEVQVVGPTRLVRPAAHQLVGSRLVAIGLEELGDVWAPLDA